MLTRQSYFRDSESDCSTICYLREMSHDVMQSFVTLSANSPCFTIKTESFAHALGNDDSAKPRNCSIVRAGYGYETKADQTLSSLREGVATPDYLGVGFGHETMHFSAFHCQCVCVCLSVCPLVGNSLLKRLFVLKTLSHTQRATKVKKFVGPETTVQELCREA